MHKNNKLQDELEELSQKEKKQSDTENSKKKNPQHEKTDVETINLDMLIQGLDNLLEELDK